VPESQQDVFGIPSLLWNVTDFGKLWLFNVSLSFKKCQTGKVISSSTDVVAAVTQFRQNARESRIISFDNCPEERTLDSLCIGARGMKFLSRHEIVCITAHEGSRRSRN
jgi:hypothetical protein